MTCSRCKTELSVEKSFCEICFQKNKHFFLSNGLVSNDFEKKMDEVIDYLDINKKDDSSSLADWVQYNWNSIEVITQFLKDGLIGSESTKTILNRLEVLINRCISNELHIAVVGTVKAGKSTFLNAWSGQELMSAHVTPETATLTKIKECGLKNPSLIISFYSQDEWQDIWKQSNKAFRDEYQNLGAEQYRKEWVGRKNIYHENVNESFLRDEIYRMTSSKSAVHFFIKDITISTRGVGLPTNVLLVDTPGLNDIVNYRSDITRTYLQRADAAIVCIKSDRLTRTEQKILEDVFLQIGNPSMVFVLATQADGLNRPILDWNTQKKEWVKILSKNSLFESHDLAEKNIISVSGKMHIFLERFDDMDKDSDMFFELSSMLTKYRISFEEVPDYIDELQKIAGISEVKKRILEEVVEGREEYFLNQIKQELKMIKKDTLECLSCLYLELKRMEANENSEINIRKSELELVLTELSYTRELVETSRSKGMEQFLFSLESLIEKNIK